MSAGTLTVPQLAQLQRMALGRGAPVTATCHGERVTLASLFYRGLADRQPRPRQGRTSAPQADAGAPDQAWAYTITPAGLDALAGVLGVTR